MLAKLHADNEAINWARETNKDDPRMLALIENLRPKSDNEMEPGFFYDTQHLFFKETNDYKNLDEFFIHDRICQLYDEGMSVTEILEKYPELSRKSEYIVADDIDQIKDYFKEFIEDPEREYVIALSYVWQKKPEDGGTSYGTWRWHKWGPYVGKWDPQCEYLNDEDFGPDFPGYVICAHIKRLKKSIQE